MSCCHGTGTGSGQTGRLPLIEPEDAARQVMRGLRGRAFEIHFPKRFTLAVKLLRLLPYSLSLRWASRLN